MKKKGFLLKVGKTDDFRIKVLTELSCHIVSLSCVTVGGGGHKHTEKHTVPPFRKAFFLLMFQYIDLKHRTPSGGVEWTRH